MALSGICSTHSSHVFRKLPGCKGPSHAARPQLVPAAWRGPAESTLQKLFAWQYGSSKQHLPTVIFNLVLATGEVVQLPAVTLNAPSRDDSVHEEKKGQGKGRAKVDGYPVPVRMVQILSLHFGAVISCRCCGACCILARQCDVCETGRECWAVWATAHRRRTHLALGMLHNSLPL